MVYKDKKLLEMNNKMLETEKVIMDLQETISEKNEVIRGRDKAIKVKNTHEPSLKLELLETGSALLIEQSFFSPAAYSRRFNRPRSADQGPCCCR